MLKRLCRLTYDKLLGLNFYAPPSPDSHTPQTGQWATRIYLVLLIGSLAIFIFYSSLTYNTETIIVTQPTLNIFHNLQSNNKQDLSCPCKHISIPQSSLISFSPEFHEFCTSDFLSDYWFKFLTDIESVQQLSNNNWRWGSLVKFRFLESMCKLTASMVDDAVRTFGQTRIITAVALTESMLDSQTDLLTRTMIDGIAASFSRSIDMMIMTRRYEHVLSAYTTMFRLGFDINFATLSLPRFKNETCDCLKDVTCSEQIVLTINQKIVPVPGWYMGCYVIDSLLYSTLECYYDPVCIHSIYAAYEIWHWVPRPWDISAPRPRPLNATRATMSRMPPNATVRDCISELFVEKWNVKPNFEAYYAACQPIQCTYTERIRKNFISTATTIVALLGGLTKALDILVPNTVRFLAGPARRFCRRLYTKICKRRSCISTVVTIAH